MRHSPRHTTRRLLVAGVATLAGSVLIAAVVYVRAAVPDLPELRRGSTDSLALASVAYTSDGVELARFYRENRTWVPLDEVAPVVVDALVATEDRRFWRHSGIDLVRLIGATWHTVRGDRQGASTITMQLVRNRFDVIGRASAIHRKLGEVLTAVKIERRYQKREILELYLNTVPFGRRTHGIDQAARTYFSKPPARLDTTEAALLIGLLKGPSHYDPLRHPESALQRRDVVLGQMVRHGTLDAGALAHLRRQSLGLRYYPPGHDRRLAPHFAEHVRRWLERWTDMHDRDLYTSGLRIHTTLDARLQRAADAALRQQVDELQRVAAYEWSARRPRLLHRTPGKYPPVDRPFAHFWETHPDVLDARLRRTSQYHRLARTGLAADSVLRRLRDDAALLDSVRTAYTRLEAGLVAIDPRAGHVKAWVGGRDFSQNQYDKVALARRQPGSAFKPLVYAAAFERGFAPADSVRDLARTYGRSWTPTNDGAASGRAISLRDALAFSTNTVAAALMDAVGPHAVIDVARRLGIRSRLDAVPALALGSEEVSLLELTGAYAGLAAGGLHHAPTVVARIEDRYGRLLYESPAAAERTVAPEIAYAVVDVLRDVVDRGTGSDVRRTFGLRGDLAGKTGTSQRGADGWFMLMHPTLVTGVWTGFDDRRLHFRTDHWAQGGHTALRIAGAFARIVQNDSTTRLPDVRFAAPYGYREAAPHRTVVRDPVLAQFDELGRGGAAYDTSRAHRPSTDLDAEEQLRHSLDMAGDTTTTSTSRFTRRSGHDAESLLRHQPGVVRRTRAGSRE